MKNNFNKLDYGALLSLAVYLILNILMWSVLPKSSVPEIMRSCVIAVFLYLAPIIAAQFKIKIAYHILGFVMVIYTFSFVLAAFLFTNHSYPLVFRIVLALIAIFGIVVNAVWYRWLFQDLKENLKQHYNHKK